MNFEPLLQPVSFNVRFQSLAAYNRDFAGSGSITVGADALVVVGRQRGRLWRGARIEAAISFDQIRDVHADGDAVQFRTYYGRSGQQNTPFVVFCENATAAAQLAALLPSARSEANAEADAFHAKLRELTTPHGVFGSITNLIIGVNIVAFIVMGLLGAGWLETASMKPYALYVANNAAATGAGEWWRLVTSMFVHYGLLHLALNMWALFQVGHLVEKLFGRLLFTTAYFGSGIVGGIATLLWHGDKVWSAGASGAVFGVYGALLGYLWREKHGMPRDVLQPLLKSTLTFAGYNLVYGTVHPQIDNVCHVGGLLGGVLFGWICALPLDAEVRTAQTPRRLGQCGVVMAVALGAAVAFVPHYNYRVRDELRWEDAVTERASEEQAIVNAGEKLFAAVEKPNGEKQLCMWLRDRAIPFYTAWRSQLAALPLRVGTSTARRRDALVKIFTMKVDSYRGLLDGLLARDPKVGEKYVAQQRAIDAAMAALAKN